jgi:NitT/TauT family transport system permease protein
MNATIKRQLITVASAIALFAALLLLWLGVIRLFNIPPYMLPTPAAVAAAAHERFPSLLASLWITAQEAASGLAASIVLGLAVALIFAQSRWVRRLLFPYTLLLQTVPIVAIAPLILMWIGAGQLAVTTVAFIICLAPIIANTTQGLISVDRTLLDLFTMNRASRLEVLFKLRLPHAMPALFTGIRISSGIAVIGAIIGELFGGSSRVGEGGLGYAIQYASTQMETGYLFALVGAATVLGFAFFFATLFLEWYFLHNWHESARPTEDE